MLDVATPGAPVLWILRAGGPDLSGLIPVIALLVAGIVSALVMRKIRMSPIVGYFLAGIVIGPYAFGWVEDDATIHLLAELGVVFLLFDIGLHFSVRRLWESRRQIFGLGPLQMGLATVILAPAAYLFGCPPLGALLVGAGLALSSTAVVIRNLIERRQLGSPVGQASVSVLIFQDLAAVVLLVTATAMGQQDTSLGAALGQTALRAVIAVAAVSIVGRLLLRPAFSWITRTENEEVFTATALLIVLATATATGLAGLSMPLGAFLGGLILSETEYCYLVKAELRPFRGLLLGLFFLTVGMSLNLGVIAASPLLLAGVLVGLVIAKVLAISLAARMSRFTKGSSIELAFVLAQGSEFALVLFGLEPMREAIGHDAAALLAAAVVASLALTPLLVAIGQGLAVRAAAASAGKHPAGSKQKGPSDPEDATQGRVLLVGLGDLGLGVARALHTSGVAYLGLDRSSSRFAKASGQGLVVSFGDGYQPRFLEEAGLESARALVLTDEPPGDEAESLAADLRRRFPNLALLASPRDDDARARLEKAGVEIVAPAPITSEDSETLPAAIARHPDVDIDREARIAALAHHLFAMVPCDTDGIARWERERNVESQLAHTVPRNP